MWCGVPPATVPRRHPALGQPQQANANPSPRIPSRPSSPYPAPLSSTPPNPVFPRLASSPAHTSGFHWVQQIPDGSFVAHKGFIGTPHAPLISKDLAARSCACVRMCTEMVTWRHAAAASGAFGEAPYGATRRPRVCQNVVVATCDSGHWGLRWSAEGEVHRNGELVACDRCHWGFW